jgi:hypothetical protein
METKRPTTWEDVMNWIRNYEARHRHDPPEPDEAQPAEETER